MPEIIRFSLNAFEEMAFTHTDGREKTSDFGPAQYYRGTTDGRGVYLDLIVEQKVLELEIQPGERVSIGKFEKRNGRKREGIEWKVVRVDAPGQPEAAQPARTAPTAAATPMQRQTQERPTRPVTPNGTPPAKSSVPSEEGIIQPKPNGSATTNSTTPKERPISHTVLSQTLSASMISTVDAFLATQEYAKAHGLTIECHLDLTGDLLQRLATSAFIAIMDGKLHALQGRQQMREADDQRRVAKVSAQANGGAAWPQ
jgi:hypothetical protein